MIADLKIYLINLKDRQDRLTQFKALPALQQMPPIEYISAIKGADLDIIHNTDIGILTRVHCLTGYRRSHYEIHSAGAIGASMSHLKAWKAFLKTDAPYALIMEDDADLPITFSMMVNDCIKDLPPLWDIWTIGWNHSIGDSKYIKYEGPIQEVIQFSGAHCYIVSRKAAKLLVKEALPIETHIEYYIINVALLYKLNIIKHRELHIRQMDRVKNVSDIYKATGCKACHLDDNSDVINARDEYINGQKID